MASVIELVFLLHTQLADAEPKERFCVAGNIVL